MAITIPTQRPTSKTYVGRGGRPTGTSTPWGKADSQTLFAQGFIRVGTPSHGGYGVTMKFANDLVLSHEARRRAIFQNGRFWFEEDCLYAILFWELGRAWWPVLFQDQEFESDPNGGTALLDASQYRYGVNEVMGRIGVRRHLRETISAWNADYLLERDETPDAAMFARWTAMQEDDRLRREKSPLLITSAMDKGHQEPYGERVTLVATADGKYHVVRAGTYQVRTPNYLANCDILDSDVEMRFY